MLTKSTTCLMELAACLQNLSHVLGSCDMLPEFATYSIELATCLRNQLHVQQQKKGVIECDPISPSMNQLKTNAHV